MDRIRIVGGQTLNGVIRISGAKNAVLKLMAAALAGTVRDVDTPGVLGRTPPQLLAILPDNLERVPK